MAIDSYQKIFLFEKHQPKSATTKFIFYFKKKSGNVEKCQ